MSLAIQSLRSGLDRAGLRLDQELLALLAVFLGFDDPERCLAPACPGRAGFRVTIFRRYRFLHSA